jgi:arylsulfatase A-like enzyme
MWDGRQPALKPVRRREMTLNIDMAPTLLEYAGVEAPSHMQGRSLKPLIDGKTWRPRREFFYEHHYSKNVVIPRCEAIRTEEWKYVRYLDPEPNYEELYNLRRDPQENDNLLAKAPAQAEKLRDRRLRWLSALDAWERGKTWAEPRI